MLVCFLSRDSAEIYRMKDGAHEKIFSGPPGDATPAGGFGKKVLVLARGLVHHTRKRLPPTTRENIAKVIRMELGDLFPVAPSAFFSRIAEETVNYSSVDVWGWETSAYGAVEGSFGFGYVVPEDLLHVSEKPEVRVIEEAGLFHLIACDARGFREGTSEKALTGGSLKTFIQSLGEFGYGLDAIRLFVNKRPIPEEPFGGIGLRYETGAASELLLPQVQGLQLKEFGVSRRITYASKIPLLLKVAACGVIVYSLTMVVNGMRFDRAIGETSRDLAVKRAELAKISVQGKDEGGDAYRDMEERLKQVPDALPVIDSLARNLPSDAYVTRLAFGEGTVEAVIAARDPLHVLEILSKAECVKTANVKGAFAASKTGMMNLPVTLELKSCE